jgi:hypothetical protein
MGFPGDVLSVELWAGEYSYFALPADFGGLNLVVSGTNPAYSASDFLQVYPRFGGVPVTLTGTLTAGSNTVPVNTVTGIGAGQIIIGPGLPTGTTIASVTPGTTPSITLSQEATIIGQVTLTVFPCPLVPIFVLTMYVNLASATLNQARWLDWWQFAMALFTAHYLTLYLRSEGNPTSTPGAAALAGLEKGITISKSAGDVSTTAEILDWVAEWGAWAETTYGTQLVTMAKVVGFGPTLIP